MNDDTDSCMDNAKEVWSATQVTLARKGPQKRRLPVNRRPKYYWSNLSNVEAELRQFWSIDCGIDLGSCLSPNAPKQSPPSLSQLPPIPNNMLLFQYQRHDLRAAIATHGGRERLSQLLGGAPILPGRWKEALQQSPVLQQLVKQHPHVRQERPEPWTKKQPTRDHSNKKPKGYWSLPVIIQELYVFCLWFFLFYYYVIMIIV